MHFENQNQGHAERLRPERRLHLRKMPLHIPDVRVAREALGKMRMTTRYLNHVAGTPCEGSFLRPTEKPVGEYWKTARCVFCGQRVGVSAFTGNFGKHYPK